MAKTRNNKEYVLVDRTLQDVIAIFHDKRKALDCAYRYAKLCEWNYRTKIIIKIGYEQEGRYNFENGGIVEVLERDATTNVKGFEYDAPDFEEKF